MVTNNKGSSSASFRLNLARHLQKLWSKAANGFGDFRPASRQGLTLIELLVAIVLIAVLIGVLIALLLPTTGGPIKSKRFQARFEMAILSFAIQAYQSNYSQMPVPGIPTGQDITYGFGSIISNGDLMVILMDLNEGVNSNHALNPQHIVFFSPGRTVNDQTSPGYTVRWTISCAIRGEPPMSSHWT